MWVMSGTLVLHYVGVYSIHEFSMDSTWQDSMTNIVTGKQKVCVCVCVGGGRGGGEIQRVPSHAFHNLTQNPVPTEHVNTGAIYKD